MIIKYNYQKLINNYSHKYNILFYLKSMSLTEFKFNDEVKLIPNGRL